jgi:hypothetical protein
MEGVILKSLQGERSNTSAAGGVPHIKQIFFSSTKSLENYIAAAEDGKNKFEKNLQHTESS